STKGPSRRGPPLWIRFATSPLPVPVSPCRRIGGSRREPCERARSWRIFSQSSRIPGLSPSRSTRRLIADRILRQREFGPLVGVEWLGVANGESWPPAAARRRMGHRQPLPGSGILHETDGASGSFLASK